MSHALVLFLALLFVPAIFSTTSTTPTKNDPCKYTSTSGLHYDLTLYPYEMQHFQSSPSASIYMRPCSGIFSSGGSDCPEESTVCMIDSSGKAINFGSEHAVQWADGKDGSVEAIYGNGELCNNGIPRKTVVDYICTSAFDHKLVTSIIVNVTMIDSCTAHFIVDNVCSIEMYCGSVHDSDDCSSKEVTKGHCKWNKTTSKCVYNDEKSNGKCYMFGIVLIVSGSTLLLLSVCSLCVCLLNRRKSRASRKGSNVRKGKKVSVKEPEYTPFQVPFQLVPGGFAPNPYSEVQGYPMTTFVTPGDQE